MKIFSIFHVDPCEWQCNPSATSIIIWVTPSKNVSLSICGQQRSRSTCASAQSDQCLHCPQTESGYNRMFQCFKKGLTVNAGKTKIMICGTGLDLLKSSGEFLALRSGQWQHLLQWLQALGAQEMQWAQVIDKGPWLQMYMVPGCTPLGLQTTEGSPSDLTSWRW